MSTSNTQKLIKHPKKEIEIAISSGLIHHTQKMYISTNVAKKFLSLVSKHFKSQHLRKLFNKNNVKVSYSCTDNMRSIINRHNSKLSKPEKQPIRECNCRKKDECPLNGECRQPSVVYKCEVSAPNQPDKVYIGLTEKDFKVRWNSHKLSINNAKYKNSTSLSTYIWELKDKFNTTPSLKWSIIKCVKSYSANSRSCALCLQEKFEILNYPDKEVLLNKRSELISKCRHTNKFLLANYKSKD